MGLLNGRFAAITGAAGPRGLGRAMAQIFAEHGATVAILDLNAAEAQAVAAELGPDHVGLACDVTDKAACDAAIADLIARWGRIDILVNNAGITQPLKLMEIAAANYDAVLDVNLRGTLYASQAAIPQMRAQGAGSIVNISSVATAGVNRVPYSAAKGGVNALTRSIAMEYSGSGIRINAVAPGGTEAPPRLTPRNDEQPSEQEKAWYQQVVDQTVASSLMRRYGTLAEQANAILFLASDEASYITGVTIPVSGGKSKG